MIIKSLLEIAFYSSLLVVKKIGTTLEEALPFTSKEKTAQVVAPPTLPSQKEEKQQPVQVVKKEKGTTISSKPNIEPKAEPKIAKETVINYSSKTKKELYEIAQELEIDGRSTMNKAELIKALKANSKK